MSRRANLRGYVVKRKLIEMCGGKCKICGYNKCIGAFDFHHRDPTQKKFSLNDAVNSGFSWQSILEEIEKCDLLCCRCHREAEYIEPDIDIENTYKSFLRTKHVDTLGKKEGIPTKQELEIMLSEFSSREISRSFNVSLATVGYWKMKYGLKMNKVIRSIRIPSREELQNLIKEKTAVVIGRDFGVTDKAVKKWLIKYGIKNPRSEIYGRSNRQIPWNEWINPPVEYEKDGDVGQWIV